MDFSRPEHWSGQPFPSPGGLPNPGIKSRSPTLQADSLPAEPQENNKIKIHLMKVKQVSRDTQRGVFFFFLLEYSWFTMLYYSQVNQLHIHIYWLSFLDSFPDSHYRALSRIPWTCGIFNSFFKNFFRSNPLSSLKNVFLVRFLVKIWLGDLHYQIKHSNSSFKLP